MKKQLSFSINNWTIDTPKKLKIARKVFDLVYKYSQETGEPVEYIGENLKVVGQHLNAKYKFDKFMWDIVQKNKLFSIDI